MITYVNTVLVSNNGAELYTTKSTFVEGVTAANKAALVGKFVFMNLDPLAPTIMPGDGEPDQVVLPNPYELPQSGIVKKFKVGVITNNWITTPQGKFIPVVKWSNEIKTADIKNIAKLDHPGTDATEDTVVIDFTENFPTTLATRGGFPIIVRLSFKDMPTRYRQWSESYDYFVKPGDTPAIIAAAFAEIINSQTKRARVAAEASSGALTLTALPYDDNETADSENFNAKVRFNATVWYSDPLAPGFASSNKYGIGAIAKINGYDYPASAKNIRDRERTAQGYQGILNRSEWYDRKPAMMVDMNKQYGALTIEFENMYRAADDIFRKTKQTVELYASASNGTAVAADSIASGLADAISTWVEALASVNEVDNSDQQDLVA